MQTKLGIIRRTLAAAAMVLLAAAPVLAQTQSHAAPAASLKRADFRGVSVGLQAQHIAEWAVHSGDHRGLPFIIVDKRNARLYAFSSGGRLIRSTPVLIGMGVGDAFAPGVADMDMYDTQPWQRITPAGRYYAEEGKNLKGQTVLWVDYDNAIAIHKMPTKPTAQRRAERMRSPNPDDHRITYGCINVLPSFYDKVVHPHFKRRGGIVYVLPDTKPLKTVFRSYDVIERSSTDPMRQTTRASGTRRF